MRRFFLAAAALVLLPVGAAAQQTPAMQAGTWSGSLTLPNGTTHALSVQVSADADSVAATLTIPEAPLPPMPLLEPKLTSAGKLMFGFSPDGQPVICTLTKDPADGHWGGPCVADDGSQGTMVLTPPKKG